MNARSKRAQQWKEKLCFEIRPNLCRLATFLVLKISRLPMWESLELATKTYLTTMSKKASEWEMKRTN